ncbi:MAG: carbonic anhydrase, partial [Gammaproteobacteria bacterium]
LLDKIKPAVLSVRKSEAKESIADPKILAQKVAERNVQLTVENIRKQSALLNAMEKNGEIGIVGAMYDVETGKAVFYRDR